MSKLGVETVPQIVTRGWLVNVSDIESRDVDMQSQQLQRGFDTELEDLYQSMSDYAIWNETAEFARGNRPDFLTESLNPGGLVRLDVDTFLVLDRNLETRASLALDATAVQEYEIPPDADLLAAIRQAVTSGQLSGTSERRRMRGTLAPINHDLITDDRVEGIQSRIAVE